MNNNKIIYFLDDCLDKAGVKAYGDYAEFTSKQLYDLVAASLSANLFDVDFGESKEKTGKKCYIVKEQGEHTIDFSIGTEKKFETQGYKNALIIRVLNDRERAKAFMEDRTISPFHTWGDGWPGWDKLRAGIEECNDVLREAKVFAYTKEKFGTYRCDLLSMWDGTIRHAIGEYNVRFNNKWYDKLDRLFAKIMRVTGIVSLVNKRQIKAVNEGFQKVYIKYPEVVNELVSDIDIYKWIKPCEAGDIDGEFICSKYWTSVNSIQTAEEAMPDLAKEADDGNKKPKKKKTSTSGAKTEEHTGDGGTAENTSKPKKKRGRKKKNDAVLNIEVDLARNKDVNVITIKNPNKKKKEE